MQNDSPGKKKKGDEKKWGTLVQNVPGAFIFRLTYPISYMQIRANASGVFVENSGIPRH
jgi:hypothetical protein